MENLSANLSKSGWDSFRASLQLLQPDFYSQNTLLVADQLLGKVLLVRDRNRFMACRIVEAEAYGAGDPASHSARGMTPRSEIMFGDPGRAYVYLIYGMYPMLNFVTEKKGQPGAVLIRALEPLFGEEVLRKRKKTLKIVELTSGPGKLCKALGITLQDNGASLQGPRLQVFEDPAFGRGKVRISPRIGISQGRDLFWRYYLDQNPFVSRTLENKQSLPLRNGGINDQDP